MSSFLDDTNNPGVVRCVYIPRYQYGFGFTLRHFIVYPPELYANEGNSGSEDTGRKRLGQVTEPVDTIFVKSVKHDGPAARAGLCVGDRVVSVNGEQISGKSYDQVVQLIQKSPAQLCLEVTPKQYDTLQRFFEEKAYRPETNQRPGSIAPSSSVGGSNNNVVSIYVNSNHPNNPSSNYNYYHPSNYIPSNSSKTNSSNHPQHPQQYQQQQPHQHPHHRTATRHSSEATSRPRRILEESGGGRNDLYDYNGREGKDRNGFYYNPKLAQSEPIYNNASYESVFLPISENHSSAHTNRNMSSSSPSPHQQKQQDGDARHQLHQQQQLLSHLPRPTPYKSAVVWSHLTPSQQQAQLQSNNQLYSQPRSYPSASTKVHQPQAYYPFNQATSGISDTVSGGNYGAVLRGIREETSGAKSHESVLAVSTGEGGVGSGNRYGSMECLPTGSSTGIGGGGGPQGPDRNNPWRVTPGYRYSISTGPMELDCRRDSTISLPPSSNVTNFSYAQMMRQDGGGGDRSEFGGKEGHSSKSPKPTLRDMSLFHSVDTGELDSPLVDRIRRSCEQKEEFLKRPNQPFVWAPSATSTATPGFPKELYAKPQKFQSVPWPPPSIALSNVPGGGGLQQSMSTPTANILVNSPQTQSSAHPVSRTSSANSFNHRDSEGTGDKRPQGGDYTLADYGSAKNRLTVVGSGKLHCDPPPDWAAPPTVIVHSSSNLENMSAGSPSSIITTSIHSKNIGLSKPGNTTNANDETDYIVQNRNGSTPRNNTKISQSDALPVIKSSRKNKSRTPPTSNPSIRPPRPDHLLLPKKLIFRVNQTHNHHNSSSYTDNDVILRKRETDAAEYDNDRLVRRVSYLKATSSPIDMERKSSSPTSPTKSFDYDENLLLLPPLRKSTTDPGSSPGRRRSMANKLSSDFLHKGRIVRLKQFFEDRTQPSSLFRFYTDSPSTEFRHFGSLRSEKSPDDSEILKDGPVHFKVRAGENKKVGYYRPWKQGWAQLRRSGHLYLCKEHITKDSISCNDENGTILCIGLKNGIAVEHAEDYSKRKNVIRIKTCSPSVSSINNNGVGGPNLPAGPNVTLLTSPSSEGPSVLPSAEILIQADDSSEMGQWLKILQQQQDNNNYYNNANTKQNIVLTSSSMAPSSSNANTSLTNGTQSTDITTKTNIFKQLLTSSSGSTSFSGSSPVTGTNLNSQNLLGIHSSIGPLTNPTSPKSKTWKGKVAKQWKKIQSSTSSPGTTHPGSHYGSQGPIPESGASFGVLLEDCPPSESNPSLPRVLEICVNTMEARGLGMQGIYRIPGNNAAVSALIDSLNKGNEPSPEQDARWNDVHVISSMLKSFLRQLPDPLLTSERYDDFIRGVSDSTEEIQFDRIKALIDDLPPQNYETLRYLILHLKKVSENWERNRMDPRNLAIVFGPTLVRPAGDSVTSMVNDMKQQCKLVELLINYAYKFFPPREPVQSGSSETPEDFSPAPSATSPVGSSPQHGADSVVRIEENVPASLKESLKGSLKEAVQRKVSRQQIPPHNTYGLPTTPPPPSSKVGERSTDESGAIRSYTGLGAETEQRVRQFEQETRAYLARDGRSPNFASGKISPGITKSPGGSNQGPLSLVGRKSSPSKSDEMDPIRLDKLRLEAEWRKAKDDMENEDFYDRLADNPSSIVQHREHGLPAFLLSHNVSSSSVSSSNSAGGANSADGNETLSNLSSSHATTSTWPMKLGPTPFKPTYASTSMVPTLPPKPPLSSQYSGGSATNSSIKVAKFLSTSTSVPGGSFSPVRKVSSVEQLYGENITHRSMSYGPPSDQFDQNKVTGKETIQRLKRQDSSTVPSHDAKIFGSLDSLRDIVNGSSKEDLSPRSSDGSDLVASLTRALDKKLEALRPQVKQTLADVKNKIEENGCEQEEDNPTRIVDVVAESVPITATVAEMNASNISDSAAVPGNNGIWKGRSKSLIEHSRRKTINGDIHADHAENDEKQDSLGVSYRDPSLHRSASAKAGSKSAEKRMMELLGQNAESVTAVKDVSYRRGHHKRQSSISSTKDGKPVNNRLSKDPRRRHSLSGTADILRLVLEDHRRQGNGVTVVGRPSIQHHHHHHHHHIHHGAAPPTDNLATALAANNILESHV